MMNQNENVNYESILNTIQQWPTAQQIELVQDVLQALSPRISPPQTLHKTLDKALAILATDKPAPTDAEVKQWLDEHRMEKYG